MKMEMKILFSILFPLIICGCVIKEQRIKPTPSMVSGLWETTSWHGYVPYSLLRLDPVGNGVLVAPGENGNIVIELDDFVSNASSFEITFNLEDEPLRLTGNFKDEQLCFDGSKIEYPEDFEVGENSSLFTCFTRIEDMSKFRKLALGELEKL